MAKVNLATSNVFRMFRSILADVMVPLWSVLVTTVVTTARDKIRTKSGIDAKSQRPGLCQIVKGKVPYTI